MRFAPLAVLLACSSGAPPAAPAPSAPPTGTPATEASAPAAPAAQPGATDVAGLKSAMDKGAVTVVDVRTREEYALGHVPGAVNIPIDELEGRVSELDPYRKQDLYLICAVGGRSARATRLLADKGFERPINVEGGTNGWQSAGYPLQ